MDTQSFAQPGVAFGGTTLWMLNDRLEADELRRQLRGFKDAGWGAVIDRTFNGLRTPYLSDEWHRLVRATIDEAAKLGMKVWLQAGYMPGGVPELPAEARQLALTRRPASEPAAEGDAPLASRGGFTYYARCFPHAVDLLSIRACAAYIEQSYTDCLERHYGDELGRTVETVWVDEPHFNPPHLPWSTELPGRFSSLWGYDLLAELESLFAETGEFLRTRHHYWRTVVAMLLEAYFAQIRAWCEAHGVRFGGHLMGEDTLQAQISWAGACMPCYEHMGIPGIDHLTRSLRWPAERSFILTPKQCSSVSNQLGKPKTLAEMYGVSSQGLDFEDRKRIGDWLLMLGINERCYHGSFYSLRGRRKRIYAPHLSHQQPWWPYNRVVSDYFSRLSYVMRQGSYAADVLVIHPLESAFCRYEGSTEENQHERVREPGPVRAMTDSLIELSENLLRIHRGFDYGDESMLARLASVEGSLFRVGKMSYRVVILPELLTIRASTLELLRRFLSAGGALLSIGALPTRVDGVTSPDARSILRDAQPARNAPDDLAELLDIVAPAASRLEPIGGSSPEWLWMHERLVDGKRVFVVANTGGRGRVRALLTVTGTGSFAVWDTRTGAVAPAPSQESANGTSAATVDLADTASVVLVFAPGAAATARGRVAPTRPSLVLPVEGPFDVVASSPNALPLDFCRYQTASSDWSERLPVVAVQETLVRERYAGRVTLRFDFQAHEVPSSLGIAIEDAAEHEISLNGARLRPDSGSSYLDASFRLVDATAAVRPGENVLELSRTFEPPSESRFSLGALFHTSTGTELESIYLVGSFSVRSRDTQGPRGCRRLAPAFSLGPAARTTAGDLLRDGFPFLAGEVTLRRTVNLQPAEGRRVLLALGELHAVLARVELNGRSVGEIAWPPYEVDVTGRLRPGTNELLITLVSSLRGLLGPHHRPSGEPDQVWSDGWTGLSGPGRRDSALRAGADWASRRSSPAVYWTDDYLVLPFGMGSAPAFVYRSED
jgi:hypothetical protein